MQSLTLQAQYLTSATLHRVSPRNVLTVSLEAKVACCTSCSCSGVRAFFITQKPCLEMLSLAALISEALRNNGALSGAFECKSALQLQYHKIRQLHVIATTGFQPQGSFASCGSAASQFSCHFCCSWGCNNGSSSSRGVMLFGGYRSAASA